MIRITDLDTPSLIIDREKLKKNIDFAHARARELGVAWRPHLKTHKCVEIARMQLEGAAGPATVSTVREAEYFVAAGIRDLIYAVGIAPHKLARIDALNRAGADVKIILDNVPAAKAVSDFCRTRGSRIGVLIEIDCDGHRSGLKPNDPEMIAVAQSLTDGAHFMGVLTHAGESYNAHSQEEIETAAENEECSILAARDLLASAGFTSTIVSVGSTPTFVRARRHLAGVTEYRSGVGAFYDLVMAGIGVCRPEDIALSVLVSVIGWQEEKSWIITDGGWLAMSRDRGTASQSVDCGYGLVCDIKGNIIADLWVRQCNQEHGVICRRDGKPFDVKAYGIDAKFRIL
ncbi:MAG: alanine racemase, partial [Duodenibacillus sp.]|nr:alanine racemase [Duodenibacillus sp.]